MHGAWGRDSERGDDAGQAAVAALFLVGEGKADRGALCRRRGSICLSSVSFSFSSFASSVFFFLEPDWAQQVSDLEIAHLGVFPFDRGHWDRGREDEELVARRRWGEAREVLWDFAGDVCSSRRMPPAAAASLRGLFVFLFFPADVTSHRRHQPVQ